MFSQDEIKIGLPYRLSTLNKIGIAVKHDTDGTTLFDMGINFDGHTGKYDELPNKTGWYACYGNVSAVIDYTIGDFVIINGKEIVTVAGFKLDSDGNLVVKYTDSPSSLVKNCAASAVKSVDTLKTKYKVGDRVKIKRYLLDGTDGPRVTFGFTPHMQKHHTVTIKAIKHTERNGRPILMFVVEENIFNYSEEMFLCLAGRDDAGFKLGDKVRLRAGFTVGYQNGTDAFINDIMLKRVPFTLKTEETGLYDWGGSDTWGYKTEWLEHFSEEKEVEVKELTLAQISALLGYEVKVVK